MLKPIEVMHAQLDKTLNVSIRHDLKCSVVHLTCSGRGLPVFQTGLVDQLVTLRRFTRFIGAG